MLGCHLEKNKGRCTYEPCDRKGRFCECITYHWRVKQLPGCFFLPEGERPYDRSIRRFIAENR